MTDFFKVLTDNIKNHDRIIIMTHDIPDLDGMGAAIAFHAILKKMGKENYIVAPKRLINSSLVKALDYYEDTIFFKYENSINGENNLLVIFDVDQYNFVEAPFLLDKISDKIIIDHHNCGANKIDNVICEYIDSDMSSTVEIICKYLKYLDITLNSKIYTILMAGLCVDTNDFNMKTTSETFEIASFLLKNGADLEKKQEFLKQNMYDVLNLYSYIEKSEKLDNNVYLCVIDDREITNIDVARCASELLKIEGVNLSFCIGRSSSDDILISARSLGNIDVSKMMLKLGGGGHFSSAAARVNGSLEGVIEKLKLIIKGE